MAWAQTATFKVSTNVDNPENCYQIKNGNDIWMAANTAPTQNNAALFAFFAADGDNAYKIYSIGKKQWVSYDKTSTTDNTKGFATLVDSQDAANPWKITASAIKGGKSGFNVQPFNNDGSVGNRYWNWNGGVNVGGGYSYDDHRTIGIWKQNANTDAGSGWVFVQENVEYTITDIAGNVYEGITQFVNDAPSFSGVSGYTLTDPKWDGSKYSAKIVFPFPVSKEGGVTNMTTIAIAAENKKWCATENSVIMVQTSGYDANDNNWLWAIYPQFNNGAFTFKIKSIGQDKWIYTNASGSKVDGGNNDDSAGNAAGAVQLTDEGTAFAVVNSNTNGTYAFHYKVGNNNQYLSINSKNDTKVFLGVHTGTHVGTDCRFNYVKTVTPPAFDGEGTEASPYLIDSADKLATLRDEVNGGEAYDGKYFKLTSDIALNGEWTAIGNGSRSSKSYTGNAFKGIFDGGDNTISGLTITSTTGNDAAIGLFGVVDGGTVKNLNLEVNINVANSNLAGGAIGMMLNGATAENITVNGAIVGNDGVGGIVGRLVIDGTIANCTNNASVTSNYGGIGGIVGKAYYEDGANTATFASITNCTNKGTITAPMYVGGIAGLARANVSGCVNEGVIAGGTQTGGIVGQLMAAGTVSANENKAKVTGTSHVGGIIGDYTQSGSYTYNNVSIVNNTNRGVVSATGDCAAILGCNNVDGFTAMTATGNQSFYFVEGLELFGNPEDMVIDATNKFVVPVAQVGADTFYTFAEAAAAAAQAGGEIKLLANIDGDIEVPAGVKLNGNGFAVNGVVTALGEITFAGVTKATNFGVKYASTVVNIPAGASLQLTGAERMVIGHGCKFNITGTIEDAKTADKTALVPSLKIAAGASITGNGVTFNVNNAYIVAKANTTSKNSAANGTFNFNINNSIWDQTGVLAFYVPKDGMDPVVNFDLKNSVLTTTSHLVFDVTKGEVVIDNSKVNEGVNRQLENLSTMTIKNGSVVNGAVATSSNAKNPGTIIVENATYAVTGEFSGSDLGTGTLIIKKGATVSAGSITKANITIDATDMAAGDEINFTANLSQFTGTLSVINNDKLEAKIVDGKIVLAAKPVAKIGEQGYATLEEAFKAATEGQTITLVDDATPVLQSQRAITKAAEIDLGGKTLTLTEDDLYFGTTTFKNGTIVVDPSVKPSTAVFWMFANQTLTFDNVKIVATGVTGTYLIGLEGENSDLNLLNGSEILVENTTALDLDIICVNGTNTCDIKVENSKVNVTNLDGRVFFHGNYTVKNSEVNLAGITKAGFRIEAGQTLSIEGSSKVIIEGEPRDGGIHLTDVTAKYIKADTATVSATLNRPAVAKIGDTPYYSLSEAFAAVTDDAQTVVVLCDVTENLTGAYLRGNITTENGAKVTITLTNSDWVYCPYTFVIGENVTLKVPALFYYAGGAQINGTVIADAYYQRYANTKLTINEPGSMTVTTEQFYLRYVDDDANAGIYINGDNNDETIGLNLAVAYFYQGMINAKNANIKAGTYWQTNGTDGQGSANLVLDNSKLVVSVYDHPAKATGNSTVTLTNGSVIDAKNGGFTYGDNTTLSVDATSKIIGKNGALVELPVATINGKKYTTLQDAVNAVQNGETITLTNDIAEDVTLTEKTGLYYTIDGDGKQFKGSISVNSLSDTNDNRRITIKNIKFVDDSAAKVDFISSVATNHYPRLTVEGCTFTGNGDATDVAVRLKSSHSVVIKDCTGTSLHSFIQNTSGWNLTIEGVTVTNSKGAFALGTVQGVTVKGCTADVQGYGIRLDAQYNNNAVLESNNIKAFIPVVVRKAEVESNVTVQGTNTMNATNTDGIWFAAGTSEYETNGQMPTAATGQVVVTLNDTNLDNEGIYGDYVVLAGKGTEAEPYLIKDVKELEAFRNSVNGGETRYSAPGVWVALGADIDLEGLNWVGIGSVTAEHGFMGNFDGKGFKIQNLTINEPALDSDGYAYAGFFGVTEGTDKDNQNTIKNLTIENVTITTTGHIVSAAIAYPYYTIVDNVKVCGKIEIKGGNYTAGVLAYTRRCVNASYLSIVGNDGSFVKGNQIVGGVISDIQMNGGLTAVYSNFSAEGITVSGTKSVGGISGIIATQTLNGAAVKKVTLNSEDGFAGIVAGRLGGPSTITGVVAENVTGATTLIGATYDGAKAVQAKIGDTYYATLDNALMAEGNEVELLTTYEVAAGETKTLDLKGKTVTMVYTAKATKNHTMVSNSGNLTIESSVAGGKLSYTYAGENLGTTCSANTVTSEPGSVLTVKSGTIENLTFDSGVIAYAIDGRTNGGAGDVTVNIEGGVITSKRQAVRIFANSTTNTGALNISGGEFTGRVIVQNASAKANKAALNITGGTFNANEYKSDVLYVGGSSSATIEIQASVSGGTFNGEITETNVTKFISGGTYKNAVEAAYCADGYMPNKNVNGTYGVVAVADAYAIINGVTYSSLKAAVAAAKAGETIILLQNVKENVTISKHLTIDGAGKTITGMITTDGKSLKVTIKNVNFDGDNATINYAMRADDDLNLVVEDCSVSNYLYGFLYANKSNDKIVVKNVTVENCAEYGAYLVSFNKASFENFEVTGTTKYGVAVANAGNRIVNFKNVSFEDAYTPLHINETGTGKVTFNFSGINDMGKAEFFTSQYVNVVAAAQVGTKVCGSLQDAVVAAKDGETVKVLADVNMTTANFVTQVDGYATLVNVAGKAVTIDLNGKKVTVNAAHADLNGKAKSDMLMAVFHADPNGTLTLTDSSAEATGTVELKANDAKVYGLIVSENAGDKTKSGKIVVNGGTYVADKVSDSMIFADTNEVITVNGGNFHLGNIGTGTNGSPWIFNTSGRGSIHINVNGGTYNANIAKQYYSNEVNLGEGLTTTNNGDGTWTVVSGVATVGEELFGTIQEALDAAQDGETVKLVADVTLDTKKYTTQVDNLVVLFNVKGKAVTFDLNGKKIDVNASAANLGGKMLAGVFSADLEGNFTITDSSAEGTGAVTVTVNDANVYSVFLSENAGDKTKSGKMTVNAGNFTTIGKVANAMIFADTDKVITINGGTFICDGVSTSEVYPWLVNNHGNNEKQVTINGGTFNVDINHQYRPFEVFVPETLAVKANDNGTWTIVPAQAYVTEMLGAYVNEPGSREHKVGYATVAEAIAATNDLGKVVTILAGDYTMDIAANKAGVTVQGEVDENGQNLVNITGRVVPSTGTTVKNLNVKNEKKGNYDCALYVDGKDITIDGVNLSGYNGIRMGYAKGNITIKNSVIEGSSNAVHFDGSEDGVIAFENSTITGYCAYASTIESVTYTNCTLNKGQYFGQRFYNKNVNFVDCTFGEGFKIELTGSKQNVTFTDADMTMEDVKALMKKESYITSHNVKLNDTQVTYAVSAQGKLYNTLQAAINDLPVGGTATYWANLKSDNVLTAPVTVPAGVKVVVNLNGFDITYTSDVAGEAMITNNGELGFDGNGEVVYTYTGAADAAYTKGNYTIANRGKLTIDGGIIKNATAAMKHASYAIDNEGNATLVINGGQVINTNNYAIRQFASGNNANSITVNGGEVSGTRAVWMQAAGSNTADAPAIKLNVTGGKLIGTGESADYTLAVYSYNYGNSLKNVAINIEGGEIVGDIALTGGKNKTVAETVEITGGTITNIYSYADDAVAEKTINITGGSFLNEISETYLAWGYQLTGDAAPYVVKNTGRRETVTIVDGQLTEFVNEEDIEVGTLTYKRELYNDLLWNALFVPFEIPVSTLTDLGLEVVYFNDVHSYDDDNNGTIDRMTMESIKLTNGTLRANHPYMFRRTSDDAVIDLNLTLTDVTLYSTNEDALMSVGCSSAYTNYEIGGTYQQMSAADLDGRLIINEEGNWTLMDEAYTLSPFRLHLTIEQKAGSPVIIEESALRAISIRVIGEGNGDTTDIKYYDVENQNVELIFDLQGRRVLEPKKGGIYIINGKKVYYNK